MNNIPWWEIFGWAGSVLVVVSLMVPSVRRFRRLNAAGSFIATVYNAVFGIWPYFAMNAVITVIDLYWLARLRRDKNEATGQSTEAGGDGAGRRYSVASVKPSDPIAQIFLNRHADEIAKTFPAAGAQGLAGLEDVVMIMHRDELIGALGLRGAADGRGEILFDWVTDRFRDYTPGSFVYSNRELFGSLGVKELSIASSNTTDRDYFMKQGFSENGSQLTRVI